MAAYTRRAFAGFCGAAAVFAAFGGAVKAADGVSETALVRPPGAQDELHLLASCVKCDRCRSVCHTGVIGVAEVGDGFLRARTPKLNFHRGSCDFCGDCQRVCPTGAIGAFDPEADKMGMAVVQKDRCVATTRGASSARRPARSRRSRLMETAIPWWTPTDATAAACARTCARRLCTAASRAARGAASWW